MKTKKLSPQQRIALILGAFALFITMACTGPCPIGDSMCIADCVGDPQTCSSH